MEVLGSVLLMLSSPRLKVPQLAGASYVQDSTVSFALLDNYLFSAFTKSMELIYFLCKREMAQYKTPHTALPKVNSFKKGRKDILLGRLTNI